MTTIRDVASACGVSVATVSGVLNNVPDAAGSETRQRVMAMVRQMGYSPNAVARGLSHGRMNTIGVVVDYLGWGSLVGDQHLGPIMDGIIQQNSRLGQKTLLHPVPWSDAASNLASICDGFSDGLLLIVPIVGDSFFSALFQRRTPFVIIGDFRAEPDLSAVDLDNVEAGRHITAYLLGLGHTRIAMLRGDETHRSSSLRAQGYREALENAGSGYDPLLDLPGSYHFEAGHAGVLRLLSLPPALRPTALFCGDDRIALGAIAALQEHGIPVPGEMSVVGINASSEGSASDPPLTTLRQPGREIGEAAVDLLLSQITKAKEAGGKISVPGELIIRSTTGPPKTVSFVHNARH